MGGDPPNGLGRALMRRLSAAFGLGRSWDFFFFPEIWGARLEAAFAKPGGGKALRAWIDQSARTNSTQRWLFPGRRGLAASGPARSSRRGPGAQ